jgi:pimeloyl-ACP methyl ester carboxylesterase
VASWHPLDPRLHVEIIGREDAPTVALLHGMMSTNRQWALNVDALSARLRLVLIELWGHGGSPAPADVAAYGSEGLVAALDDVRASIGVESWARVGHSYGGAVALHYARHRPSAVRAVVWTNSRAAMSTAGPRQAASIAEAIGDDPRSIPQHPQNARRFPPDLHAAMIDDADRTDLAALRELFRLHWQLSSRDHLAGLTMPVTLLNGRYERLFQDDVAWIRAHAPNVAIVDLEAGHSPNIESPDEFDAAVLAALT